jgi:putative acetyltransferase
VTPVNIEPVPAPTDELRALIFELDSELAVAYTTEQMHGLTLNSLFAGHIQMFIARIDGAPVGCGGLALFDGYAEVKRMFVRPAGRGSGVAQALLAHIEDAARTAGVPWLRLETGIRQPAAIRLYESAGFHPCAAFGAYTTMAPAAIKLSLFYEKSLRDPGAG